MIETQEEYTTEIAIFGIKELTESNLMLMKEQILEIPETPETAEQYNTVKGMHIQSKKLLPKIETRRKEKKKPHWDKCLEIDATAKTAVGWVKPLVELSGDRRAAWEAIAETEKDYEREREDFRLECIIKSIEDLKLQTAYCIAHGLHSDMITQEIALLSSYPITEELFEEHLHTAEEIQKSGIEQGNLSLSNRIKLEQEHTELQAQKKAQAELEAKNKAEADRLAKIAADQEAENARVKAEQEKAAKKIVADQAKEQAKIDAANAKAKADQEAQAQKLADEKAAFEAEKKAMEDAEEKRIADAALAKEKAEIVARNKINCERIKNAWPHYRAAMIEKHMPEALEMNAEEDRKNEAKMDADAKRKQDLLKDGNKISLMNLAIVEAINKTYPELKDGDARMLVADFGVNVERLVGNLKSDLSDIK